MGGPGALLSEHTRRPGRGCGEQGVAHPREPRSDDGRQLKDGDGQQGTAARGRPEAPRTHSAKVLAAHLQTG